jgi:hypothetical protein
MALRHGREDALARAAAYVAGRVEKGEACLRWELVGVMGRWLRSGSNGEGTVEEVSMRKEVLRHVLESISSSRAVRRVAGGVGALEGQSQRGGWLRSQGSCVHSSVLCVCVDLSRGL